MRQDTKEGSTLEITYDLRGTGLTYKTAANLAIFPKNSDDDVITVAKRFGFKLDERFVFKNNPNSAKKGSLKHPFPTPITVREAIEYFVDLRGTIRKKTLKDISEHCKNETEKTRLKTIADSKSEFTDEIEKR